MMQYSKLLLRYQPDWPVQQEIFKKKVCSSSSGMNSESFFVPHLFPGTSLGWDSIPSKKTSCQSTFPVPCAVRCPQGKDLIFFAWRCHIMQFYHEWLHFFLPPFTREENFLGESNPSQPEEHHKSQLYPLHHGLMVTLKHSWEQVTLVTKSPLSGLRDCYISTVTSFL